MQFKNKERTFMRRVLFTLKQRHLIFILGIVFICGVFTMDIILTLILCMWVALFIFIISFFKNVVYLQSVVLDDTAGKIEIILLKFDNIKSANTYFVGDVELECYERRFVYSAYYLKVWYKGVLVIRQPAVGGWNKQIFDTIVSEYKKIKNLK